MPRNQGPQGLATASNSTAFASLLDAVNGILVGRHAQIIDGPDDDFLRVDTPVPRSELRDSWGTPVVDQEGREIINLVDAPASSSSSRAPSSSGS